MLQLLNILWTLLTPEMLYMFETNAGQNQIELTEAEAIPCLLSDQSISWCSLLAGCSQICSMKCNEILLSFGSFSSRWDFEKAGRMLLYAQISVYFVNPAEKQSGSLVLLLCSDLWWRTLGFRFEWDLSQNLSWEFYAVLWSFSVINSSISQIYTSIGTAIVVVSGIL